MIEQEPKRLTHSLEHDLSDGLKLIALVEQLTGRRIRKIPRPINHHQWLENVQFALNAIEEDGIKLVNIGNEDIVNGNLKLILGLIWSLINRYQIGRTNFPPKKLMLAWLQAVLPECKVKNFTTDWNSGIYLSALLDFCQPGLFPHWRELDQRQGQRNCERAMELAQKEFGIPMVLDPEYLASPHLDELSGMTYLSYFMKENSPGYTSTLEWARKAIPQMRLNNFTTDFNDGTAVCHLVKSLGGPVPGYKDGLYTSEAEWVPNWEKAHKGGAKLGVTPLLKPKEMADPGISHLAPMAYVARYIWCPRRMSPGDRIQVSCDTRHNRVGVPVNFQLQFLEDDVDINDIEVSVVGPRGVRPPVDVDFGKNGGTGTYIPDVHGMYQIVVSYEGEKCRGCPVAVRATPEGPRHTVGGIEPCAVGSIVEVLVNSNGSGGIEEVDVTAYSPSEKEHSLPVHDDNGIYLATFQPDEAGEWSIAVTYETEHIEGSPYSCFVFDPNAVKVRES
ncbi:unnamed protein product, partial [Cyprideis torosa]